MSLRIGIVAGESSGDFLGASLITALRKKVPDLVVEGIGGPEMINSGCRSHYPMQTLSVMGLVEVLGNYIKLSRIRTRLGNYFTENPPDLFIGIDAPDFNLGLERKLKSHGIKTVHYVSPSVWAWREYRLNNIKKSVDLMLTLFPFETDYYSQRGIPAACVGHPLAKQIPLQPDQQSARDRLGLAHDKTIVAVMPGSRKMELNNLSVTFIQTMKMCFDNFKDIHFATSMVSDSDILNLKRVMADMSLQHLPLSIFKGQSHSVLEAADIALLASGTVTLEAMLFKKPMVVAYTVNWLTYQLLKLLLRVKFVSLPNILAGEEIVPECLQHDCTPERLYNELSGWLNNPEKWPGLTRKFTELHRSLEIDVEEAISGEIMKLAGLG